MLTALLGLLWHLLAPLLRLLRLAAPEAAAPPRPAAMLRPPGPPRGAREVLPDSKWLWFPVDPAAGTDARGMPRFKHAPAGGACARGAAAASRARRPPRAHALPARRAVCPYSPPAPAVGGWVRASCPQGAQSAARRP